MAGVEFYDAVCPAGELACSCGEVPRSWAQTRYEEGNCCHAAAAPGEG
jgi:hypothetical protein